MNIENDIKFMAGIMAELPSNQEAAWLRVRSEIERLRSLATAEQIATDLNGQEIKRLRAAMQKVIDAAGGNGWFCRDLASALGSPERTEKADG